MYAIIESGGKQYQVKEGDKISVEKLSAQQGEKVTFNVLLASGEKGVVTGTPYIKGATVEGEVLGQYKEKKIVVFRYKPKKNVRKKQGHRQPYTLVKINSIKV
jgi:large subunit ribosomal protein L21